MTTLTQVTTQQANKETTINENFVAVAASGFGGYKAAASAGLTWGYYGGAFLNNAGSVVQIADGALSLTNGATNYVYADAATGAIGVNTTGFVSTVIPLYTVVTSANVVTSSTDQRIMLNAVTSTSSTFLQSAYTQRAPRLPYQLGSGIMLDLGTSISTAATASIGAFHPNGLWYYQPNNASATVSQYSIDRTSGALTSIAAAAATGTTPQVCVVDPTGRWLYVTNQGSNSVSQFSINQTTGALTSIAAAIGSGSSPIEIYCDPTGRWLYVACTGTTNTSTYSINQTTGQLTSLGAVSVGSVNWSVCVEPTGRYAYVTKISANQVVQCSINQSTGALTVGTSYSTGSAPLGIAVDPSGRFLYVSNSSATTTNNISIFSINSSTGNLTAIGNATTGVTNAAFIRIDPTGNFLAVSAPTPGPNNVYLFSINQSTGLLTLIQTIAAGTTAWGLAFDPRGSFGVLLWTGSLLKTLFANSLNIGAGNVAGQLQVYGGLIVGDPGTEGTGINVGGTTYDAVLKVSDITTSDIALFGLHRHSTTLEPLVIGSRSHSTGSSHSAVLSGDGLFSIYAVGYGTTAYQQGGIMRFAATGTGSDTSMPTSWTLSLSASGSVVPAAVITANPDKSVLFSGILALGGAAVSSTTALSLPASTTGVSSLRIPHGSAPTAPADGDVWTTTAGIFVRINGTTVGPLT